MLFKNLLKKWGESLEVLKPKNIKLFSLASLNTFIKSITIFFKYFWWLYILLIATFLIPGIFGISRILVNSIMLAASTFITFFLFLTIRSSIERKDFSYFMQYSNKIFGYLIIPFLIGLLSLPLTAILYLGATILNIANEPNLFISLVAVTSCSILPTSWMGYFFYFDSKDTFSSIIPSIKKAFTVLFYYLPFMLIVSLVSIMIGYFSSKNATLVNISNKTIIVTIIGPIINALFMSILSVYYTRVKHKDFKLFFKK